MRNRDLHVFFNYPSMVYFYWSNPRFNFSLVEMNPRVHDSVVMVVEFHSVSGGSKTTRRFRHHTWISPYKISNDILWKFILVIKNYWISPETIWNCMTVTNLVHTIGFNSNKSYTTLDSIEFCYFTFNHVCFCFPIKRI